MDVIDFFKDCLVVIGIIDQVDRLGVDGEQGAVVVVIEKPGIGFGQAQQVIITDLLLIADAATRDALT